MKLLLTCALLLSATVAPAPEAPSARQILDDAAMVVFKVPYLTRVDTIDQVTTILEGERPGAKLPIHNEVTLTLDRARRLARLDGKAGEFPLTLLKSGENAAIHVGTAPWAVVAGSYKYMMKSLDNLFVCETEVPEAGDLKPAWKVVGEETWEGEPALLIEAAGKEMLALAEARMNQGFEHLGSQGPKASTQVLKYASRHWIAQRDHRRLKTEQRFLAVTTIVMPEGHRQVLEVSSTSLSRYRYDKVQIDVPQEVLALWKANPTP